MEQCRIILDDGSGREFDKRLDGPRVLAEGGDLEVVTKDAATVEGNPAVLFTFTVELPGGARWKAQTVVTARIVQAIAAAIRGKYGLIE